VNKFNEIMFMGNKHEIYYRSPTPKDKNPITQAQDGAQVT
jgi:hypothetical protein